MMAGGRTIRAGPQPQDIATVETAQEKIYNLHGERAVQVRLKGLAQSLRDPRIRVLELDAEAIPDDVVANTMPSSCWH